MYRFVLRHMLPLMTSVLAVIMLSATSCATGSGNEISTAALAQSSQSMITRTIPTVTGTKGVSSTPLPGNIPLPAHSVLSREYAATLDAHTGTAWVYEVVGASTTPASVISFYQTNMLTNGWAAVAVPSETAQGKYGGTALAYTQNGHICTIATGISQDHPRAVTLVITLGS